MASDTATEALVILNNTPVSPVDPVIENPIVPLGDLAWTHAMEQAMYSEMVNQHRLFKRAAAGFKSEAWVPILAAIQAVTTTGHRVNKLQCQGKTSNHKAKWAVWRHLLIDLSGWGWDPVTKLLLAEDDQWKMQIKVRTQRDYCSSNFC